MNARRGWLICQQSVLFTTQVSYIKLLDAIGEAKPERIVYVSCDPSTLARDLKILEEKGYEVVEVQPVDMFPMTSHIENCALLVKRV